MSAVDAVTGDRVDSTFITGIVLDLPGVWGVTNIAEIETNIARDEHNNRIHKVRVNLVKWVARCLGTGAHHDHA